MKKAIFYLGIGLSLCRCAGPTSGTDAELAAEQTSAPVAWPQAVHYEVFVQSFADSNGDGIGDLPGLTSKLDYLQDLGVKGLWLMPIQPSPSYHKYDVTDYYGIHPDYGSLEDFKELLKEAHQRDIKVIMDLVVNHTGRDHPWFQNAQSGPQAQYRDYYVWAKKDSIANQIAKKETTLDSDNITQWHDVPGQEESYYGFFWGGMPDLNFDNPKVKEEIFKVGRYWLQEVGVDGFRLDAARHIFPDDRPRDNWAFWQEFRKEMEQAKPDVFLVGEVWTPAKEAAPYLKGLHSLFNFDLGYAITRAIQIGNADSLLLAYRQIQEVYQQQSPDYVDATFLTNHDQNRILSELGGQIPKAKLAASILLTLPGAPFIYYGEELGMLGTKPDPNIREPFLWAPAAEDSLRTHWIEAEYSTENSVRPLSVQQSDSNSIYYHYRSLIHLRNSRPTLQHGQIEELAGYPPGVLAFNRCYQSDTLTVLHNMMPEPILVTAEGTALFGPPVKMGKVPLGAYQTSILKY